MRCRTCNYPLWNLTTRQCPECGAPFKPSDFEFVADSVRFCCPHCRRAYYGRSEKGHLEPSEFDCVDCGAHLTLDEMVVEPCPDIAEKRTRPGNMPWFERSHRGRVKAFFQTIGMAMVQPKTLINGVPADSRAGQALVYATQTTIILAMIGVLIPCLLWLLAYYGVGTFWAGGPGGAIWLSLLFGLPIWLLLPFGVLGLAVFWPMITHLALRWTGGCAHPVDRTIHAFAYSAGANVLTAIPCIGFMFGWIWWLISATIMLKFAQKVSGLRAVIAVAVLPGVLVVGSVAIIAIGAWAESRMMAGMVGMAGGGMGGFSPRTQSTWSVNQMLMGSAWQTGGAGPTHIIENMVSGQLYLYSTFTRAGGMTTASSELCHPGSKTTDADILVGDITLKDFLNGTSGEKLRAAADLLQALPRDLIAYRFGDYIFTYPGSDLTSMDAQLWTVIMLPDPDVNGIPGPKESIHIATADMNVQETTYDQMPALLAAQNQHRATLGLPPLPNPVTITHRKPASESSTSAEGGSEEDDGS